jgi:hypothetical protein
MKIRIKQANTDRAICVNTHNLRLADFIRVLDFTEELRQAAIWSKE